MNFTRRHFVAAGAAVAGLSATALSSSSRRFLAAPPVGVTAPRAIERPPLIEEALTALERHGRRIVHHDRIGVVDFSRPSREPRLHLVDVASGRIERSLLVAHGSGSDPLRTGLLHRFSNEIGSNATSRGAYLTANCYVGKHGRSQRLIGLDADNDQALERAIVIHGANYVDRALVESQGRIGRSQGCFAVEPAEVAAVMDALGEGRLIYAGKA